MFTAVTMASLHLFVRFAEKPTPGRGIPWGLSVGIVPNLSPVGLGVVVAYVIYIVSLLLVRLGGFRDYAVPALIIIVLTASAAYGMPGTVKYLTTKNRLDVRDNRFVDFASEGIGYVLFIKSDGRSIYGAFLGLIVITALGGAVTGFRRGPTPLLLLIFVTVLAGGYIVSLFTLVKYVCLIPLVPPLFILSAGYISRIRYRTVLITLTVFLLASYSLFFWEFFDRFRLQ
jgi:hypothetical protein